MWTPLVMARISWPATSRHVALAVRPCSWLTALARVVRRRHRAVMSNSAALPSGPRPSSMMRSTSRPAPATIGCGQPPHEVRREALVAGRDGRVDGEHGRRADRREGVLEGRPGGHQLAHPLHQQERRVALVEVPCRRLDAQGAQGTHAAHAEHDLLVQAHLAPADVQDVRDRTILRRVLRHVRVEQQEGHAAHLHPPDRALDRPPGQVHRHEQRPAVLADDALERHAARVEVRVGVLLVAVRVDGLAEVAVAVEQADADEREGHVRGRLAVVAGEDAEAARVEAERLVQAVLGAEVGHRPGQGRSGTGGVPVAGAVGEVRVETGQDGLDSRP